jgi:exonuclease III
MNIITNNQITPSSNISAPINNSFIFNQPNTNTLPTSQNLQNPQNISSTMDEHIWTISTCNLRELSNKTKRDLWFQYSHDNNWDIIISTETDGNLTQSNFWKSQFFKTWWTHGSNKLGQGIGISLSPKLAPRVFKTHSWEGRILVLDLSFPKKRFLRIIGIYYPANPNTPKQKIDSKVKQFITEASKNNWHTILAGDFNAVNNPSLDKISSLKNFQKQKPSNHLL